MSKRKTKEERQHEIRLSAKKVFLKKGYQNATMEDIIHETTLSKGGFYHYYKSKKEIIIDMMEKFNVLYQNENPYMLALEEAKTKDDVKAIMLDAILDKILIVTDDRKLYLMFCHEMMFDDEIKRCFFKMEEEFLKKLSEKMGTSYESHLEDKIFISRMINAILMSQSLVGEPEVFQDKREDFKMLFEKYIEVLIE